MAKDMVIRRKHLQYKFKQLPAKAVRIEHMKTPVRAERAKSVTFLDDADGRMYTLK